MSLPRLSVEQPVLVTLLVLLIVVGGWFSYRGMVQERYPSVPTGVVAVTTLMPGGTPLEMEQLVTIPLEEEIGKLEDIDYIGSRSSDGRSYIWVVFQPGVEDLLDKVTAIQSSIRQVESFPEEAEEPRVEERRFLYHDTVTVSLIGEASQPGVRSFAQDLERALQGIPGVEEVEVAGLLRRQVWVEVDPHRLQVYGLSLAAVADALGRRNLRLSGGVLRLGPRDVSVRADTQIDSLEEILDTVLLEGDDGGQVHVRDLATVRDTFEEPRSLARWNGRPSIQLTVRKSTRSHASTVARAVRRVVTEMAPRAPAGTELEVAKDSSLDIGGRLSSLYQNFFGGLLLVILTVSAFVGWRAALAIAAGLPVAALLTFICLYALGQSMNTLVLFALTLVLGLLVDDAIVVCENIYRYLEAGVAPHLAAIRGTEEVLWPVVATALTTVAAFLPLLLMEGALGKFMAVIPVVVSLALLASLLESFLILPSHVVEWGGPRGARSERRQPLLEGLKRSYLWVLPGLLRWRYGVVAATVVMAVVALLLAASMDFVLIGDRDVDELNLTLEAPAGTSFAATTRLLSELEARCVEAVGRQDLKTFESVVGFMRRGNTRTRALNVGEIRFELVDRRQRSRPGWLIEENLRRAAAQVPGLASLTVERGGDGPPVGKAVLTRLQGPDLGTLQALATEVQGFLRSMDGVVDVQSNYASGRSEVRPVLDVDRLAAVGLDVETVATELRGAYEGLEATRIRDGRDELEVVVKYDAASRSSQTALEEMRFVSAAGLVPLRNVGHLERGESFSQIFRHDRQRAVEVLADVIPGRATSRGVNRKLRQHFANLEARYPGYTLELGGENRDTQESLRSLMRALLVAVILIYVILGGLFQSYVQPFIVMLSVPFAFTGVVVGFFVLDEPLGLFSIVGIIGLSGIVVNDSLVLLDFINQRRKQGAEPAEAILEACHTRMRPILLTSLTTIAGLLPLSMGLFGVDPFLKPMAMAIAWGLTFSTVLVLLVVPCVYRIFDDLSLWLSGRWLAVAGSAESAAEATVERPGRVEAA